MELLVKSKGLFTMQGSKMLKASKMRDLWKTSYNTWIEPFVGGGSILVAEKPKKAIINDFNPFIMHLWEWVKNTPKEELTKANEERIRFYYEQTKEDYNEIRDNLNDEYRKGGKINSLHNFICIFNTRHGEVRYNDRGLYTTYLKQVNRDIHKAYGRLEEIHDFLNERDIKMFNKDYKYICKMARKGDLVAIDPPYFMTTGYPRVWKEADYEELKSVVDMLDDKGVKFFICNSDNEYLRNLFKDYNIAEYHTLNQMTPGIVGTKRNEIIIKNY